MNQFFSTLPQNLTVLVLEYWYILAGAVIFTIITHIARTMKLIIKLILTSGILFVLTFIIRIIGGAFLR